MVTTTDSQTLDNKAILAGLSTDTKPTHIPETPNVDIPNGSEFIEIDTGKRYLFDSVNNKWYEQPASSGGGSTPPTNGITLADITFTARPGFAITEIVKWTDGTIVRLGFLIEGSFTSGHTTVATLDKIIPEVQTCSGVGNTSTGQALNGYTELDGQLSVVTSFSGYGITRIMYTFPAKKK